MTNQLSLVKRQRCCSELDAKQIKDKLDCLANILAAQRDHNVAAAVGTVPPFSMSCCCRNNVCLWATFQIPNCNQLGGIFPRTTKYAGGRFRSAVRPRSTEVYVSL